MKKLTAQEIRDTWINFFTKKCPRLHKHIPSASLVPDNPTLLLNSAGMVQFVPIFMGTKPAPEPPRAISIQKCARVGGKDSDKIVAEDVNLEFAKDRFSLISAKPGNIFKNPILIRWDLQEGKFALAENPQNPVLGVDTESKPTLLELEFMPLSSGNGAKISLGEESLVYLYKVGPVYLRGAAGYYQIKD